MKIILTETDVEVASDRFAPGDKVKVVGGPLLGLEGKIVDFPGNRRVMVRLDQFSKHLQVFIPAGFLEWGDISYLSDSPRKNR